MPLTETTQHTDPVAGQDVTRIRWASGLRYDHDLTRTEIAGNLVPAVQGAIVGEEFTIPGDGGTWAAVGTRAGGEVISSPF